MINLITLAFALGFDAFAVAVAIGIHAGQIDRWTVFRLSFHFGFAQFGMPIVGWLAGEPIADLMGVYGKITAGVVLAVIGARLIWEQFNPDERRWKGDPSRGMSLLVLMFATSIDALAAGFSLALIGVDILYPSMVIGITAAAMTIIGLAFGRGLGLRYSRIAGIIGGLLLIGLAVHAAMG